MKYDTFFITGSGTGVGKTVVTGLLVRYFRRKGINAITQKWVQTGCMRRAEDIEEHFKIAGEEYPTEGDKTRRMAPYILPYPASPHLASRIENIKIDKNKIVDDLRFLKKEYELVLIEGSGGVLVPFNEREYLIDIVMEIRVPVLIISENGLGAINRTLLTVEALKKRNMEILGIIFNNLSPRIDTLIAEDNVRIVEALSGVSILGEMPYCPDYRAAFNKFTQIGERVEKCVI